MKIISWNINGLNASLKTGIVDFIEEQNADIYCFQETKVSQEKISIMEKNLKDVEGYYFTWNCAERKGYSGVLTLSKKEPLSIQHGMGIDEFDAEGRLLTLEYNDFYLINGYLPNAGRGLPRLDFKIKYNENLMNFLDTLRNEKNVILTGDLNVAHQEIDLANPDSNHKTAGFTDEERKSFSELLDHGFIDTFREFNKDGGNYTFWSYRGGAREKNIGWRLDYFVVNQKFLSKVEKSDILTEVKGSDHAPIILQLK